MSDYSNYVSIDTPENILLDAEVAGFGTRFIAALIDFLILVAVLIAVGYIYWIGFGQGFENETASYALLVLFQFIIITFYHLLFELIWNGQTPGKRRVGIRVVRDNGLPASAASIVIRNLVRLFDFFPIFYAVGMVAMFATKNTQRLGDLAARTVVIREHPKITLENVQQNWAVDYLYVRRHMNIPYYIDVSTLDETDRREIVGFLQRRGEMTSKEGVVKLLANRYAERMGLSNHEEVRLDSPRQAELFLEQVARAFELREEL